MAVALRKDEDLHLSFAADMLGVSYAEALQRKNSGDSEVSELRQFAKICNFGFPGGLSAPSFVEYAEGYGVTVEPEKAKFLRDAWFKRWTEMKPYFNIVSAASESGEPITQIRSGRVRGGATYCAIANGWFQGLASDGAKEACWRVAKECYVITESPLFGARPVFMIHDELGLELPYAVWGAERSAKAAERLREIMIEAMQRWVPDVPITCRPVMMMRWFKGAEQVFVNGVLVPAKPVTEVKDGKKRTTWVADA
jgi:DNA polymerase I-like protein with 3'-5' exonuclease and polymerase domains